MAYPDPPERETSFLAFQQSQGDNSFPGQQLDVDLNNIVATITAILLFQQGVMRSDGRLQNGVVTRESLASDITLGFGAPTVWETGVSYVVPDTVFEGSAFYICIDAHTSGADFDDDLASGRWALLVDFAPVGSLLASNNLSDLPDVPTARTNLGLGSVAVENTVPLTKGGSGATTATGARANFGLGAVAIENVVPVTKGGSGATTPASARNNFGLGSVATENVVPVTKGGSGATTAADARTAFGVSLATEAQARAGNLNLTTSLMTPLRTADAIEAQTLGFDQTWQDVSGSRTHSTSYQNATGKPIMVSIYRAGNGVPTQVSANNVDWVSIASGVNVGDHQFVVPPGHYYRINGNPSVIYIWAELR